MVPERLGSHQGKDVCPRRTAIIAGRFQPYHNGHHALVRDVLASSDDQVFIAVIISQRPPFMGANTTTVEGIAHEHHQPQRNPWSAWDRCEAIRAVWSEDPNVGRVRIAAIPRLNGPPAWWSFAQEFLPEDRHWILKWDDPFERAKQQFFHAAGEQCSEPLPPNPTVPRGKEIREIAASGGDVSGMVPEPIARMLCEQTDGH